jgi:hypothetical protein
MAEPGLGSPAGVSLGHDEFCLEEQLHHEHDAEGAAELGKAHARLIAAGGVTSTNATSH